MFRDRNAALYAAALAGLTVVSLFHLSVEGRADEKPETALFHHTGTNDWADALARSSAKHQHFQLVNQRRKSGWLFGRRRPTTGADIVYGRTNNDTARRTSRYRQHDSRQHSQPKKPARKREMDRAFLPAVVDYEKTYDPGTIVIDTGSRFLYLVLEDGKARRYGVGVGRTGFGWTGTVNVGRKAEWPGWTPPPAMRKREPWLPEYMEGGINNPLGARALYLYRGNQDTIYRIHGSNEPWTIGHAVSSGCFRMRNEDVTDLYERVGIGTKVVVL